MAKAKTVKEPETKSEPKRVESSPNRIALIKCKALVDALRDGTPLNAHEIVLLSEASEALKRTTYKNLTDKASRIESLKAELKALLKKGEAEFTDADFNRAQEIIAEMNKLEKRLQSRLK